MLNKFTIQKSFAISAGAGSGKTYTLSRRYINALVGFDYFREDYEAQKSCFEELKPAKVNEIVTITYTEAAALEMKGRIFELIGKIIQIDTLDSDDGDYDSIIKANEHISLDQRKYVVKTLTEAYTQSSNAKISTIHAYCLDIIKSNADLARIDTKLDIIKEDEKQKDLSKIIFDVLNSAENKATVLDISKDISMFFLQNLISKYVSNSKFRNDYDSFNRLNFDVNLFKSLINELYPLPDISDALDEVAEDNVRTNWLQSYYENFINFCAVPWKDVNPDEKTPSLGVKKFPETTLVKEQLDKLVSPYSEIKISYENLFFDKIEQIQSLLHQIKSQYDSKLNELGKIDFDTIITKTLEIIPQVKTNYKYIMVDEFQDTNETQFDIVKNSMNEDTNLFVVGDSKQSIYSFQGAEIEVFNNAVEDKSLFSSIEDMNKNHRSDGVVLDTVNKIFETLLQKDERLKQISSNFEAQPQALEVFKDSRKEKGSFKFLITSAQYQEEDVNELTKIADFVTEVCNSTRSDYKHISSLIASNKKAIAIVFDSSTKMLEFKELLRQRGVSAKVSASDNFYHTKEINDIFNVLKAVDILSKSSKTLSKWQKFYLVGAMRSNILRIDDNSIKIYLDSGEIPEKLSEYIDLYSKKPLAEFVKYIYDDSNIIGVYAHLDDLEQRIANLYKFLNLCQDYQNSNETSMYKFLSLIENSIYFSEAKEDEAFYKSDNARSVEICSIHSTKGLAYPLVILGNSDKGLFGQVQSESLKHNNVTVNGKKQEIVGFKINDYTPLSLRVLKEIDKLKHLAEKKRLLYVALTRAEHDVVISAKLSAKKDGDISLKTDSYLNMIIDSLDISAEELFNQTSVDCLHVFSQETKGIRNSVEYFDYQFSPIEFVSNQKISATQSSNETIDEIATKLGTITHKLFELYWNQLDSIKIETILAKFGIYDEVQKKKITSSIEKFLDSDVYQKLKSGAKHKFELEFNTNDFVGFIDLVYFDEEKEGWVIIDFKTGNETEEKKQEYARQLDFYEEVLKSSKINVINKKLLWI